MKTTDIQRQKMKEWYLNNKETKIMKSMNYYNDNIEKVKECKIKYNLKKNYNITLEEYNKLFKSQNGVCAICEEKETRTDGRSKKIRNLAVDHNHITGRNRGLLCCSCNSALGLLQDSPLIIKKALKYLEEYI